MAQSAWPLAFSVAAWFMAALEGTIVDPRCILSNITDCKGSTPTASTTISATDDVTLMTSLKARVQPQQHQPQTLPLMASHAWQGFNPNNRASQSHPRVQHPNHDLCHRTGDAAQYHPNSFLERSILLRNKRTVHRLWSNLQAPPLTLPRCQARFVSEVGSSRSFQA